jgi:prephenate dehydrogenase
MGGSLGLALLGAGVPEVRGLDPDPAALREALRMGAITHAAGSLPEAVDGAACVFVAAPVPVIAGVAREALAAAPDDCVVSDLGSAKRAVLEGLSPAERARFVGGHPICGAERAGVGSARADLYRGATWFLTPTPEGRPDLFERLHAVISATGARPAAIDAAAHDRLMALVSHVPHVLAAVLIHQAAATAPNGRQALRSAGPSFDDLTRVAGANPPLWADILLANRDAVLEEMADLRGRLTAVEAAIAAGDREGLVDFVADAARGRERLRVARGGQAVPSQPWQIVVGIPDRPGALSEIATALGHAHINIADLTLRPGPPGGVGELSITVEGRDTAAAATRLVAARGYRARSAPAAV